MAARRADLPPKKYFFGPVAVKNCPVITGIFTNPPRSPGPRSRAGLFLLLAVFALGACGETDEETRKFLEQELQSERSVDALKKIETLLAESNQENSIRLSEGPASGRRIGTSPDGDTVFWLQGARLAYRVAGTEDSRGLDLPTAPQEIRLSFSGRFGLAIYREKAAGPKKEPVCRLLPLDLARERSLEEALLVTDCESEPTISDTGVVYYGRKGAIHNQQSVPEKAAAGVLHSAAGGALPKKSFPLKYAKIKSRFIIRDLPGGGLLIFHGAAGFYRLYHYPGSGGPVKRLLEGVARPRLYPVVHHVDLRPPEAPAAPGGTDQTPEEEKPPQGAGQLRLREPKTPAFYFYIGAAGKYSLRRIEIGRTVKLGRTIKLRPLKNPVFIEQEKAFLILRKDLACLWPPGKRLEYLPLATKQLLAFNGGLVYTDNGTGALYLRPTPFTRHEQELLQLKFQAEKK